MFEEYRRNTPDSTTKTRQVNVAVNSSNSASPQKLPEKVERARSNSFSTPSPAPAPPARKRTSSGVFQVDEAEPPSKKIETNRSNSDGPKNKPEALPNGRRKATDEKDKPKEKEREKNIVVKFDRESNTKCVTAFKESDSWD